MPGNRGDRGTHRRPLLFTGVGSTAARGSPRAAPAVLPSDPVEQKLLFNEWVVQRWMPVSTVSNDRVALAAFDWAALRRAFEEDYRRTGGRCITPGRGAGAEEIVLFYQLRDREPMALLLSEEQPQPQLRRATRRQVWRANELVAVAMMTLADAGKERERYGE